MESFHTDLYYSRKTAKENIADGFFSYHKTRLTTQRQKEIDADITQDELRIAITQQKKNRTPGEDGISAEFFIDNIETIAEDLTQVLNKIYTTQDITPALSRGVIKVIHKKKPQEEI